MYYTVRPNMHVEVGLVRVQSMPIPRGRPVTAPTLSMSIFCSGPLNNGYKVFIRISRYMYGTVVYLEVVYSWLAMWLCPGIRAGCRGIKACSIINTLPIQYRNHDQSCSSETL